jgi:hypothetical protein
MYFQNNGAGPSATIQVAIGGRHVLARIDSGATTTALYRDAKSRAGVTTANLANNQHSYMSAPVLGKSSPSNTQCKPSPSAMSH